MQTIVEALKLEAPSGPAHVGSTSRLVQSRLKLGAQPQQPQQQPGPGLGLMAEVQLHMQRAQMQLHMQQLAAQAAQRQPPSAQNGVGRSRVSAPVSQGRSMAPRSVGRPPKQAPLPHQLHLEVIYLLVILLNLPKATQVEGSELFGLACMGPQRACGNC